MSDELEKAEQALATAEAAVTRAREARDAEARRIEQAQEDLRVNDERILASDPTDFKALAKLQAERGGLRIGIEVLQRARLPKVEAALVEAEAARDAARLGVGRAKLQATMAEVPRRDADLTRFVVGVVDEIVGRLAKHGEFLRGLDEEVRAQGNGSCELGSVWCKAAREAAQDASRADVFEELAFTLSRVAPTPKEVETEAYYRRRREEQAAAERAAAERLFQKNFLATVEPKRKEPPIERAGDPYDILRAEGDAALEKARRRLAEEP